MSLDSTEAPTDLIRWSFTAETDRSPAIAEHLSDLGADVLTREGVHFLVTWDEPEGPLDEVVEAIWSLNGQPFEVTQEEFRRLNLVILEHSADDQARDAA